MELILRQSTARPRLFMVLCLSVIIVVSGLYLWMSAGASLAGLISALCSPSSNTSFSALASMWLAMTLAMMIPNALPMISTYLDIAEAAKTKNMAIVSPLVLTAGYGAVWIAFALAAAFAQWSLLASGHSGFVEGRFAGFLLIGAGAYQFTSLKHACLSKCRMPMPYFLAHWTDRFTGIFRMGGAGHELLRLLLGPDGAGLRRRPDEYRLDGRGRCAHGARKDTAAAQSSVLWARFGLDRRRHLYEFCLGEIDGA